MLTLVERDRLISQVLYRLLDHANAGRWQTGSATSRSTTSACACTKRTISNWPTRSPSGGSHAPPATARKAAKAKSSAELAGDRRDTEGAWTVTAQQGNRVVAKPISIRAGEALRLIGQLDLPKVHAVTTETVAADRVAAERDADRLRAERAEVEARLADPDT